MIEQQARVVAVAAGVAWVEAERRSACSSCSTSSGCGTSVVSQLFGVRPNRLRVSDSIGVQVGDSVVIGIAENALTRASLLAYLLPLILLMLAAYGAQLAGAGQGLSALIGILALCLGMWLTARLTDSLAGRDRFQPALLRRSEAQAGTVPLAVLKPFERQFDA